MPKPKAAEIRALLNNPFTPESHKPELREQLLATEAEETAALAAEQEQKKHLSDEALYRMYPGLRPERAREQDEEKAKYQALQKKLRQQDAENQRLCDEAMEKMPKKESRPVPTDDEPDTRERHARETAIKSAMWYRLHYPGQREGEWPGV